MISFATYRKLTMKQNIFVKLAKNLSTQFVLLFMASSLENL